MEELFELIKRSIEFSDNTSLIDRFKNIKSWDSKNVIVDRMIDTLENELNEAEEYEEM